MRHRERLLRSLLIGLFSPRVRDLIQERLRTWVPGRPWRHPVVLALTTGPHSDGVINCLLRLIIDEDDSINAQAAKALANLAAARPEIGDRLIDVLGRAYPVQTQVAALEALLTAWPNRQEWPRILCEIENSPSLEVRMIAIRRKIKIGKLKRLQIEIRSSLGQGGQLGWASFMAVRLRVSCWRDGQCDNVVKKEVPRSRSSESLGRTGYGPRRSLLQSWYRDSTDDQDAREAIASLIKEQHRDYLFGCSTARGSTNVSKAFR